MNHASRQSTSSLSSHSLGKYLLYSLSGHPTSVSKKNARTILLLLCMVVVALSVLVFLKQSIRLDESQSIWQTSHSLTATYRIVAGDVHVPLYHTLLHGWSVLFGNGVATARILSLIFFIASIPAIYLLGTYAYERKVGLFSAVLFSISPYLNWYGNEIRMYSLLVLITIVNQLFFLRIWKGKQTRAWIGYTLTAILGMYTHYFFFFLLLSQAIFYLCNTSMFTKGALRRFVAVSVVLVLAMVPWLLYVLHIGQLSNEAPLIAVPTTINIFNSFSEYIFGFQNQYINTVLISLWPVAILLAFFTLEKHDGVKKETMYFLLSLLAPFIITFALSIFIRPIFLGRYLIFTIPSLYIFLSNIIFQYNYRLSYIAKIGLISIMLCTLGIEVVNARAPVKEDYRSAAAYLSQHASPNDIIVLSAPFTTYPFEYYYRGSTTTTTLPIWDPTAGGIPTFDEDTLPEQVHSLTDQRNNIWILFSYDQGYQHNIEDYFDSHYQRLLVKNISDHMDLYEYKIKY